METSRIEDYLNYLFPNPVCELSYTTDYELLIAIVLSAQSTDKRVNIVTPRLFNKYSNLKVLKMASLESIEDIIRPVGTFHKKAVFIREIARIIDEEYEGKVPNDFQLLVKMPGVGRKTANVFLSEYYKTPAIGVDTHVERVSKRLNLAKEEDDVLEIEKRLMDCFPKEIWAKIHLQMVLFGRYYCKSLNPNCYDCRLKNICIEKKKNL